MVQAFSEEGSKRDKTFVKRFMADLNTALVEQFLHVTVAQEKRC